MPGNNGGANWGGAAVDPDERHAVRRVEGPARHAASWMPDADNAPRTAGERYNSGFGFMIAQRRAVSDRAALVVA